MKDKKGFLLYSDQQEVFNQLPDEIAGKLIKHIFSYVNDEDPETDDLLIKMAFTPIKQQLKRDLEKWDNIRAKRSEAGKKSAEARRNKSQQNEQVLTSVKSVEQNSTKLTVNDNDNVNDNVNVTDNDKEISNNNISTKVETKTFSDEVNFVYDSVLPMFPDTHKPKNEKQVDKWKDTIDKLIRIDKVDAQSIIHVTEKVRSDEFWQKNFLTINKLREKKDGVSRVFDFIERFKKPIIPANYGTIDSITLPSPFKTLQEELGHE